MRRSPSHSKKKIGGIRSFAHDPTKLLRLVTPYYSPINKTILREVVCTREITWLIWPTGSSSREELNRQKVYFFLAKKLQPTPTNVGCVSVFLPCNPKCFVSPKRGLCLKMVVILNRWGKNVSHHTHTQLKKWLVHRNGGAVRRRLKPTEYLLLHTYDSYSY